MQVVESAGRGDAPLCVGDLGVMEEHLFCAASGADRRVCQAALPRLRLAAAVVAPVGYRCVAFTAQALEVVRTTESYLQLG